MKSLLSLLAVLLALAAPLPAQVTPPTGVDPERVKDAANQAIAELVKSFLDASAVTNQTTVRRYAVLPVRDDLYQGYLTDQLRNLLTRLGTARNLELYLPRQGEAWDALLKEIEWGQTAGAGALEPASVQKFGRLQGVQGLIAPRLVSVQLSEDKQLRLRLSIQAFVVETGRMLFGEEKLVTLSTERREIPQLALPAGVNPEMAKDAATQAVASALKAFAESPVLMGASAPKRFAVLPVHNDFEGGYVAGQVRNHFTRVGAAQGLELYLPREGAEWDALLREVQYAQTGATAPLDPASVQKFGRFQGVQGLLAARVLGVQLTEDHQLRLRLSLNAFIVENGRLFFGEEKVATVTIPQKEVTTPEQVQKAVEKLTPMHWKVIGAVVGGLVLLLWVGSLIKSASRPR